MTSCRLFKKTVKTASEAAALLQTEAPTKNDGEAVRTWINLLKTAGVSIGSPENSFGRRQHERFSVDCAVKLFRLMPGSAGEWREGPQITGKVHNISFG